MKKLVIVLSLFVLMGCINVSAQNPRWTDTISLGETKVITVPAPEGEIDEGTVYFQQEYLFTPEESGTYRMLMHYDEEETPYDVFLDVGGPYRQLDNGIEFDAEAGQTYSLCFQYPNHDGRYPEIAFFLGTPDMEPIPKTNDLYFLPPLLCLLLCAVLLTVSKKQYQ